MAFEHGHTEAHEADSLIGKVGGVVSRASGASSNHLQTATVNIPKYPRKGISHLQSSWEGIDLLTGTITIKEVVDVESRGCIG